MSDNINNFTKKGKMTKWQKALWNCETNIDREELTNEFMIALGVK